MSKVNKLWKKFHKIEAELEKLPKNSAAHSKKTQELLEVYERIQKAESALATWKTGEML